MWASSPSQVTFIRKIPMMPSGGVAMTTSQHLVLPAGGCQTCQMSSNLSITTVGYNNTAINETKNISESSIYTELLPICNSQIILLWKYNCINKSSMVNVMQKVLIQICGFQEVFIVRYYT